MSDAINIRLAALSECLVKACGGLVSAALECDVSKTQLHRACNPNHPYSLKASTIYHLEQACGEPILSRALLDFCAPREIPKQTPLYIGIDLAARAADLTVYISGAVEDGAVSVNEYGVITAKTTDLDTRLAELVAAFPVQPLPECFQ